MELIHSSPSSFSSFCAFFIIAPQAPKKSFARHLFGAGGSFGGFYYDFLVGSGDGTLTSVIPEAIFW
jgi:hypothetical protein